MNERTTLKRRTKNNIILTDKGNQSQICFIAAGIYVKTLSLTEFMSKVPDQRNLTHQNIQRFYR